MTFVICEHFWSVGLEQLIMGIYLMSTWFWHKNQVRHTRLHPPVGFVAQPTNRSPLGFEAETKKPSW
jgi:hypothetical protein